MLVRVSTVTVRNNLICPTLPCSWRNDFLWDTCSSDGRLVKEFSSVSRGVKPLSLSIGSRSSTILYFRSHNGTGQVELFKEVIHIDSFQRKTIHRTGGRSRQTFDFDTCHGRTDFHFGILVTVRYSRGIRQGRTTGSPCLQGFVIAAQHHIRNCRLACDFQLYSFQCSYGSTCRQ